MDQNVVGAQISALRRSKGLTQQDLGQRLGISYQAVSKWERGETLPDTAILLDLADVLETTVDHILSGDRTVVNYRGRITVEQMKDGINALKRMGELLGKDNLIYRSAIEGINERMHTEIEDAFSDERVFEAFVAEAILQNLISGKYIDVTDVRNGFQYERFRNIVLEQCRRCEIK